jgi:hypothetical protein
MRPPPFVTPHCRRPWRCEEPGGIPRPDDGLRNSVGVGVDYLGSEIVLGVFGGVACSAISG